MSREERPDEWSLFFFFLFSSSCPLSFGVLEMAMAIK